MGTGFPKCFSALIVIYCCFVFNAQAVGWFSLFKKECGKKPSIAIIGAGIGGTSCAYFLSEFFKKDVYIDIFEADEVGGRLQNQYFGGVDVELGGAVLHPRNKYIKGFVKKFGLETVRAPSGRVGIYNGKEFIFLESGWSVIDYMTMMYRYGIFNSIHFFKDAEYMLDKFDRAYNVLEREYGFRSVEHMLEYMHHSFPAMRNVTIEKAFRIAFGDLMYEEVVLPIMRVNYGQGGNLHQFVGSVSMAGAMPGLWSVKGGNRRVAEALLKASSALIMRSPVYEIRYNEFEKRYELLFPLTSHMNEPLSEMYDVVIIATPLTDDSNYPITFGPNIKTENFKLRPYHTTYVTIVEGKLNYSVFNCSVSSRPTEIYTPNSNLMFNSLTRLSINNAEIELWKIFSDEQLNPLELKKYFKDEEFFIKYEKSWYAYPEYETPALMEDSFFIQENLYYVNAIEYAASAIEMSILSAKNIAVIIHKQWLKSDLPHSCFFCKGPNNFWNKN